MSKKESKVYLVVMRYRLDDIPILTTTDPDEAFAAVRKARENAGDYAAEILGLDVADPIGVSILAFKNGKLIASEMVKEF
jgi:hypothetical protein